MTDASLAELEARYGPSRTLAVYGTLAPGRENHHIVAPLGGEWSEGFVEGDLLAEGWGASLGYPAFRPRPGGTSIMVHVLHSALLPEAWPRLDEFEGAEYRRLLVPVFRRDAHAGRALHTVANIYAAVTGLTDPTASHLTPRKP